MSKLEELIKKLCPNGVKYKKIEEFTSFEQPTKYIVKNTKYDGDYKIPVLTAGQTFILGYTNEEKGIYNASKKNPVIIFDDFTGSFKWVDFPFKVKSSAMKFITANENKILLRFLYHMMGYINFTSDEHKRLWISRYSQMQIAVPPLEVQCEIVHILDNFTLLSAELSAELSARKKQYNYYKNKLFAFDKNLTETKKLKELIEFKNGKGHEKVVDENGKYILVTSKAISTNMEQVRNTNFNLVPVYKNDITMVMSDLPNGKALAKCFLIDEEDKYTLNQRIGCFTNKNENIINTKFLFYIMNRNKQLLKYDNGVDQTNLRKNDILNIDIPIPPIDEQKKIVSILDKFYKICNDLSEGLPAEIEKRQKQYEYYRDKLLSFKEVEEDV